MTAYADGTDRGEALLWAAPAGPLPAPPIGTRTQVLPIDELGWADAEKLFLRLLDATRPVQYAKLFGVPGQAQAGIDAYARLPLEVAGGGRGGRDYITLQSRRVKSLTAAKVKKAVDDLLKGEWAGKTSAFYFATSFDLRDARLDVAIRQQTDRLAELKIAFVPWGVQEVSRLLKEHPRLVDDFFGRPWVERFCGLQAAQALASNLSRQETDELRAGLRDLYQGVFSAQGEARRGGNAEPGRQFVILDVDPSHQQSRTVSIELPEQAGEGQAPAQGPVEGQGSIGLRLGGRRQSFRSAGQLINDTSRDTSSAVGTLKADTWLAGGRYRLLVGPAGAGKSSLLRFTATDLLSPRPQSVALQRAHAADLPVWLPFGFLCRHLEASMENSLVSAAEAWLQSQSAVHLWPLVRGALQDDRLLLIVDGIDEWSDVGAAEHALGILEAFLGHTRASAVLSTRPYAVDRLNWTHRWELAEITPLTDQQRRTLAAGILAPVPQPEAEAATRPAWTAGVEPFLDQLAAAPELAEFSRSPSS
jgi:NACHT domain